MKKFLASALSLAMLVSLFPVSAAATAPKAQTKTVTLAADNIYSSLGDVSVKVTYTGWLGEIDAAACGVDAADVNAWIGGPSGSVGAIPVLKEGSEIRFTITAKDPMAYYNFCYDGIYTGDVFMPGIEYGWDDCGGGAMYFIATDTQYGYLDELSIYPIQVYGRADGSTEFSAGVIYEDDKQPFGRKTGKGEYTYHAHNGLLSYAFNAKYARDEDNTYSPNYYTARYNLGAALTISDAQVKEMCETGTMTFLKGTEFEYKHAYPGLATLLGLKEPEKKLDIQFDDDFFNSDIGPINNVTITNNTGAAVDGVYTLLMYSPKMQCKACNSNGIIPTHKDEPAAELYSFDLDLAPGKSATYTLYFGRSRSLASTKFVWVEYDDAAERARYLNSKALFQTDTLEYAAKYTPEYGQYVGYYDVEDESYLAQYPYNITLQPVTHKSFSTRREK